MEGASLRGPILSGASKTGSIAAVTAATATAATAHLLQPWLPSVYHFPNESGVLTAAQYREAQEAFVSGLNGGSLTSLTIMLLLLVPASVLLLKASLLYLVVTPSNSTDHIRQTLLWISPFWLEVIILVWLPVLYMTIAFPGITFLLLLITICGVSLLVYTNRQLSVSSPSSKLEALQGRFNTNFVSLFKGSNVVLTCIAILAVDFPIFPRELAKTETFGVSLMDIGVGSFIISSAITSRFARGLVASATGGITFATFRRALSTLTAPTKIVVLLLGVGRFVTLRLMNYQAHPSEYGIHWNFFVTLAVVWAIADASHILCSRNYLVYISVALLVFYQFILSSNERSLETWLLSSDREGLLAANKEGIYSLIGYTSLYLLTEAISFHFIFGRAENSLSMHHSNSEAESIQQSTTTDPSDNPLQRNNRSVRRINHPPQNLNIQGNNDVGNLSDVTPISSPPHSNLNRDFIRNMGVLIVGLWLTYGIIIQLSGPPSRRLCNAPYVVLSLAIAFSSIFLLYFIDNLSYSSFVNDITGKGLLENSNRHSLFVFLAANLLTGTVNQSVRTLFTPPAAALLILFVYSAIVSLIAMVSDSLLVSLRRLSGTTKP